MSVTHSSGSIARETLGEQMVCRSVTNSIESDDWGNVVAQFIGVQSRAGDIDPHWDSILFEADHANVADDGTELWKITGPNTGWGDADMLEVCQSLLQ